MSRAAAIARAHSYFDSGEFLVDLRRRVAIPSTSQEPERAALVVGQVRHGGAERIKGQWLSEKKDKSGRGEAT